MYINELPLSLDNAKVTVYSDDTSISYSSKSVDAINSAINDDLSNLKLWLEGNKLSLNVSKTQAMLIGSRAKLQSISNGDDIRPKFVIDDERSCPDDKRSKLSWNTNRQNIMLEGTYQHYCLEDFTRDKNAEICKEVRLTQYSKNHVRKYSRALFTILCTVWGCCTEADLKRLQILQNRAARILTNSAY